MITHFSTDFPSDRPCENIDDSSIYGLKAGDRFFIFKKKIMNTLRSGRNRINRIKNSFYHGKTIFNPTISENLHHLTCNSILGDFHDYEPIFYALKKPVFRLPDNKLPSKLTLQHEKRSEMGAMVSQIDCPLALLAFRFLPTAYVEEFDYRYKNVHLDKPKNKEFHASFFSSLEKRFIIARYVEEGSKLHIYQHAAMYGELENYLLHHIESSIADKFYTWGWHLKQNDIPFIALRLINSAYDHFPDKASGDIWLYVNIRQPFIWNISKTREIQERFIGSLKPDFRKKIVIRPRVNKGGSAKQQVSNNILNLIKKVDSGKTKMSSLLKHSGLVIVDMFPTTTFMECIILGIPVIAIVPQPTVFTEIATKFYDEFFKLGILHSSPESAADFLNGVSISSWWNQIMNDDLIFDYKQTFCRLSQ